MRKLKTISFTLSCGIRYFFHVYYETFKIQINDNSISYDLTVQLQQTVIENNIDKIHIIRRKKNVVPKFKTFELN